MKKIKYVSLLFILTLFVCCFTAFPVYAKADDASTATKYDVSQVASIDEGEEVSVVGGTKYVGTKALAYGDTVSFGYKNADSTVQLRMAFGIGSYGFYFYYNPGSDIDIRSCEMTTWTRKTSFTTLSRDLFNDYNEIQLTLTEKDETTVHLAMTYADGNERKIAEYDFAKVDSSDNLFRYGDMNFNGNTIKSLLPAPTFGNGFTYSGENVSGENQYGGCSLKVVSKAKASAAGVPDGFTSDTILVASGSSSSYDMSFDFSSLKYKRKHITGISFRLYIESTSSDTAAYPELRIPDGAGGWSLRYVVGTEKAGQWITVELPTATIDAICKDGILGKFVFCLRNNGSAKMFIDKIEVTTLPPDTIAPVISAAITSFQTTEGTYPDLDYITISDDSGVFDATYTWSEGALDFNGRLHVGTHTCTITAIDGWDNTTSVIITYVVTAETPVEKYSITFRADGAEDIVIEYSAETIDYIVEPKVPAKQFYRAKWAEYALEYSTTQVVTAEYTPITYTINYYVDGEKSETKTRTIDDVDFTDPAVPQKDGYTAKWAEYTFGDAEEINVNAVYTAIDYTVTFVADGEIVATLTYNYDNKTIEEPAVPQKRYYIGAWESYELKGDVSIAAVYTAEIYTITYMADGEKVGEVKYSIEDYNFDEPAVPQKEGYTGQWEEHTLNFEDLTVNAVYKKAEIPVNPESPSDEGGKKKKGCSSSVGYSIPALCVIVSVIAAVVINRKKEL